RRRRVVQHRHANRRGDLRGDDARLDFLCERPAQGPQHRADVGLVHRSVRGGVRGVLGLRPVPALPARTPARDDLADGRPRPRRAAADRAPVHPLTRSCMRFALLIPLALVSVPALAASLDLTVELPRLDVSEYHRPYVAVWIERPDHEVAANLAVWYQQRPAKDNQSGKQEEGSKWLSDLRQWWRRSGR